MIFQTLRVKHSKTSRTSRKSRGEKNRRIKREIRESGRLKGEMGLRGRKTCVNNDSSTTYMEGHEKKGKKKTKREIGLTVMMPKSYRENWEPLTTNRKYREKERESRTISLLECGRCKKKKFFFGNL